jgi:non-specific serine/threonine protein kinase
VPETAATALGAQPEPGQSPTAALVETLRPRRTLLLLDNCEHVIEACAQLATALLAACPGVQILATSREPLRVHGEQVWRVPPLELPDRHRFPASEDLSRSEAVRLFCERAALVHPEFALDEQNAPLIAKICRRLEGLPLAIELAAARLSALTLAQLEAALADPLRLLASGSRAVSPRQRTLRATLDWSYALLSEPERALLRRLSAFVGGGTLAAIESVVPGSGLQREQVWDLLFQLVEKSLVVTDASDTDGRYRLLETVRQYAAERLAEAGEVEALRARHAACYLALAEEAEPTLRGPEQSVWFARLEHEHHNLRVALAWYLERRDAQGGLRLAGALWWFWYMHAHYREGGEWLTRFLALASSEGAGEAEAPVLAKALLGAAVLLWRGGALRDALARCDASLAAYRRIGDRAGAGWALVFRAHIADALNDRAAALAALEESVALFREADDPAGLARALNSLGDEARLRGDDERAAALYEEALALDRATGHRAGQALRLHNLGYVALHRGDAGRAARLFGESLALHRELGHPRGTVMCIEGLAAAAALASEAHEAARLYAAAEAERERLRATLDTIERLERQGFLASLHRALDPVRLERAWSAGRALSLAEAVVAAERMAERLAVDQPEPGRATASLSRRERQIAALIARGLTNRQIAAELGIAPRTADTHVSRILHKLGVPARAAVAAWAREQGLVDPQA